MVKKYCMLYDFLLISIRRLFRQIKDWRTFDEHAVMDNIEQYTQGFEHEVHVQCKRSLGTLLFSFVVLLVTSL
ncbi:hypothetical protein CS557_09100 [Acinetobacter junii]|nr:hypothetical protein CS557_09100 [Acinetobacter junii]